MMHLSQKHSLIKNSVKHVKISAFFVLLFFASPLLKAQVCGTCSVIVTGNDTLQYTVNSGEVLCIDTTANFTGKLIINGGTVCNNGFCSPSSIIFNTGTINNTGNLTIFSALTLSAGKTLVNDFDAVLNQKGNLTISGGSVLNRGIFNVEQNIQFSTGTITNDNILNCLLLNGAGVIVNNGVLNTN